MTDAPPAALRLEARDVEHRFAPRRGLNRVSFTHTGPGCLAIVGPNGAGKSTLLRIVAGLLRPTGGAVELQLEGRSIAPRERRSWIGFASPELAFYDELTVGENLTFAAEARGVTERTAKVRECLAEVGLLERIDDRGAALSSGMKQRLRLAFALLDRPAVLLLDEPGTHLDDAGRERLEAIVAERRGRGLVVLATNDDREGRLAEARIELGDRLGHST